MTVSKSPRPQEPLKFPRQTTCREAAELGKKPGVRIFWRPGGVVNWMLPELDAAQVLTD